MLYLAQYDCSAYKNIRERERVLSILIMLSAAHADRVLCTLAAQYDCSAYKNIRERESIEYWAHK